MKRDRLIICLAAYDPYKDIFDVFIELFKKNWPDCPYKLIIANMNFSYESDNENIIVMNCGKIKESYIRQRMVREQFDADYYIFMEEDRMITDRVNNQDIEEILDFMDEEKLNYFRCNSSIFRKKKKNAYVGYNHFYHIPSKEPYGICGSTVIWRNEYMKELEKIGHDNGYVFENEQLKNAYYASEKWVKKAATDDRNLFNILHCIDKQRWIPSAKKKLQKMGFDIGKDREELTLFLNIYVNIRNCGKLVPIKFRYWLKKILKLLGFNFVTEY